MTKTLALSILAVGLSMGGIATASPVASPLVTVASSDGVVDTVEHSSTTKKKKKKAATAAPSEKRGS